MDKVNYSFYRGVSLKITLFSKLEIRKMIAFISPAQGDSEDETSPLWGTNGVMEGRRGG